MAKLKGDVRADLRKRREFAKVDDMERTYMVVATMLSDFPDGTQFKSRSRKEDEPSLLRYHLDDQISKLLIKWEGHPAIRDIFSFTGDQYNPYCEEVKRYLGAMFFYGGIVGLDNHGMDFDYVLADKNKLMNRVEEAREKMAIRDFEFFRGLGHEIVYNGRDKLPDTKKKARKRIRNAV